MAKTMAKVWGVIFLLVGALGFFSNPIVGNGAIFHTNPAHNVVHLAIGLLLLFVSGSEMKAAKWLKIVGVVYLLVAVLGFLMTPEMGTGSILGLVEVNGMDNWLHVALGVLVFLSGMKKGGRAQM